MPTLEWIGKDKVVNHHQEVPFRILDKKYTFHAESSENMIIHRNNLLAPKSFLPQSEGANELYNLKKICDEIFVYSCFVGQYMWYKSATPPNLSYKIKRNLEYILCYEKEENNIKYGGIKKKSI